MLDARNLNQGAPVVRNDNVVLNGNGRVAATRYAYEIGKAQNYKNALIENAARLGLDANEISKMNQPVLVREFTNDLNKEDILDVTSTQTGGSRMGASEQAQVDARKFSNNTLELFSQGDTVDLTHASATDFLRAAIGEIAAPEERNALTTSNGAISQDGINRVRRALFAAAYGDEGLISRMSESTDDNVRGVTKVLSAAPAIAKVRTGMKNGTRHNYDLNAINDAVKKLSALRDQGKPVQKYLQEQSLFGKDSAEAKEILTVLDRYKRAPNKIAAFFKKIASNIQAQGDPRFHGVRKNGISYLNVNSNKPLGKVFWHEVTHWLKHNNPELYKALEKAAGITTDQRQAYLKKSERDDIRTPADINEEIIADQMDDVHQSIALADEFGQIANKLVDQNGQKIFRYNRRTHTIELADGRNLDSVQTDEDTKYSFAGKKAKTADESLLRRAMEMEARGANRDQIFRETGWVKGKDGKWRFEIPDYRERKNLKRLIEKGNFGKPTRLEEIYDNPELYAAYPQLREIMTQAVDPSDDGIEADLVRGSDAVVYGKKNIFQHGQNL